MSNWRDDAKWILDKHGTPLVKRGSEKKETQSKSKNTKAENNGSVARTPSSSVSPNENGAFKAFERERGHVYELLNQMPKKQTQAPEGIRFDKSKTGFDLEQTKEQAKTFTKKTVKLSGVSDDVNLELNRIMDEYKTIQQTKKGPEFNHAITELVNANKATLDEYERQTGRTANLPDIMYQFEQKEKKDYENKLNEGYYKRLENYYKAAENEDFEEYINGRHNGKKIPYDKVGNAIKNIRFLTDSDFDVADNSNPVYYKYNENGQVDIIPVADKDKNTVKYLYMTDDEYKIYKYRLNKYGFKSADKFLKDLENVLDKRAADAVSAHERDFASKHKVLGTANDLALSIGSGVASAVDAKIQGIKQDNATPNDYIPYNPYSEATKPIHAQKANREGVIGDLTGGARFIGDTLFSVGENAVRLPLEFINPAVGLGLMGVNVAGQTAVEQGVNGETNANRAWNTGIVNGAIEIATEKVSLDNLIDIANAPVKTIREFAKQFAVNLPKQAGIEASEEWVAEIADNIADNVINGDKSEYNELIQKYRNDGMDRDAAEAKAFYDKFVAAPLQSAAGGALSGLIMGGGTSAITQAVNGFDSQNTDDSHDNQDSEQTPVNEPQNNPTTNRIAENNQYVNNEQDIENSKRTEVLRERLTDAIEKDMNNSTGAPSDLSDIVNANNIIQSGKYNVFDRSFVKSYADSFVKGFAEGGSAAYNNLSKQTGNLAEELANYVLTGRTAQSELTGNKYFQIAAENFKNVLSEAVNKNAITHSSAYGSDTRLAEQAEAVKNGDFSVMNVGELQNVDTYTETDPIRGLIQDEFSDILTDSERNAIDNLATTVGRTVKIVPTIGNGKADGCRIGNVLYVAANADNKFMYVFSHELTHTLESTDGYRNYSGAVLERLAKDTGMAVDELVADKMAEYDEGGITLDDTGARQELVADFTKNILSDESKAMEFVNNIENAQQRRTVIQWLCDAIRNLINNIRGNFNVDVARLNDLERISDMFEDMLREAASETSTHTENETQYLFAGTNAKTADNVALAKAEAAENEGMSAEDIRTNTGWARGLEGEWKFEIDDSKAQYMPVNMEGKRRKIVNLSDILKHDELFEAYPDLNNLPVIVAESSEYVGGGEYLPKADVITINQNPQQLDESRKSLLHEVQHAIQAREGFAEGGSVALEGEDNYERLGGEIEARDVKRRADMSAEERQSTFPESQRPRDDAIIRIAEPPFENPAPLVFDDKADYNLQQDNIDTDDVKGYNTDITIEAVPYRERRQLEDYIIQKNNRSETLNSIDCTEIGDHFYIWHNNGKNDFTLSSMIEIEGNEEFIEGIREAVSNGTYRKSGDFVTRVDRRTWSGRRGGDYYNGWGEEAGAYGGDDTLSIQSPERNEGRYFRGNSEDTARSKTAELNTDTKSDTQSSGFFDTKNQRKPQFSLSKSIEQTETPLENRLGGDKLLNAQDTIEDIRRVGGEVNDNGYVTVYHATSKDNAEVIRRTGKMIAKENGIFVSTKSDGEIMGYGDHIIQMKIPVENLVADDVFSDEMHFRIPLKNRNEVLDVSKYIDNRRNLEYTDNINGVLDRSEQNYGRNNNSKELGWVKDSSTVEIGGTVVDLGKIQQKSQNTSHAKRVHIGDVSADTVTPSGRTASQAAAVEDAQTAGLNVEFYTRATINGENQTSAFISDDTLFVPDADYEHTGISIKTGIASITPERFDYLVHEYSVENAGTSTGDYAKGYLTYISPSDFLSLTSTNPQHIMDEAQQKYGSFEMEIMQNERQTPFLSVDFETGEVTGHEGRHRIALLQKEGIKQVAIVVRPDAQTEKEKYHTSKIMGMHLTGQSWQNGARAKGDVMLSEVIPLSPKCRDEIKAKFVEVKSDVQYSLKKNKKVKSDVGNTSDFLVGKNSESQEEFANRDNSSVTNNANAAAREFVKKYNASGRVYVRDVQNAITDLAGKVQDTFYGKADVEQAYPAFEKKARDIAESIVKNARVIDASAQEAYNNIREFVKGRKLKITDDVKNDIPDWNSYRKSVMGTLTLANEGTAIDAFYKELSEQFPGYFDEQEYMTPSDQLQHIFDTVQSLKPQLNTLSEIEHDNAVEELTADIMSTALNVHANMEENQPYYSRAAVRKMREQYAERTEKLLDKIKDQRSRAAERRKNSADRTKLLNISRRLNNMKRSPENKALIPGILKEIDTVSKGILKEGYTTSDGRKVMGEIDLRKLRDDYLKIKESDPDFIPNKEIEDKILRLDKTQIADMDIGYVRELLQTLQEVEHEIRTNNKMLKDAQNREIAQVATSSIGEIRNAKGVKDSQKGSSVDKFWSTQLSPLRMANRMAGYAKDSAFVKLFKDINDGQLKSTAFKQEASKRFDALVADRENMSKFTGKNAELIDISAYAWEKAYITPAMRVSLYLHSKNYANLKHIKFGGITVPNMEMFNKGRITDAYKSNGTIIRLTPSQVHSITSQMTSFEKRFADAAYQFFNEDSKKAVNDTSLALNGYEKAVVKDYFPLVSNKNFVNMEFESLKHDGTYEGMGMLKERKYASNPIVLEDVVKVISRHMADVGDYAGLAVPIRNFNKVYSAMGSKYAYSTKQAINAKWGSNATNYIENLMTDLQGGRTEKGVALLKKLNSNYAQATLSLNVGVTLQQAGSYPTAAAVIGWKPLMQAFGEKVTDADKEIINKYTPLLWYRSQGYTTRELGDYTNGNNEDWTKRGKMPYLMGWIQKMDVATTTKLWKAAEFYVRDNNSELQPGSEDYYRAVAEVYNRVIEETQPNYTTMQRADLLRNPNAIIKATSMFRTQPSQNHNLIYDAFGEYKARRAEYEANKTEENKADCERATKRLGQTVASQVVAAMVVNACKGAGLLLKGQLGKHYGGNDEDDEGTITPTSATTQYIQDILATIMGNVWFGSDALNVLYKALSEWGVGRGAAVFDTEAPALSMMNDVVDDITAINKMAASGKSNPYYISKKVNKVATHIATMFGYPLKNAENLVKGVYKDITDVIHSRNIFDMLDDWSEGYDRTYTKNDKSKYQANMSLDEYANYQAFYEKTLEDMLAGNIRKKDGSVYTEQGAKTQARNLANKKYEYLFDKRVE